MNEQRIRWDDLQIVSAIAETGTLSGAGKQLGISHATVFRRLTNLENQLGVVLFERARTGYTPSAAGEDLFTVAKRVQEDITGVERRLAGKDLKLSGTIRVHHNRHSVCGFAGHIVRTVSWRLPRYQAGSCHLESGAQFEQTRSRRRHSPHRESARNPGWAKGWRYPAERLWATASLAEPAGTSGHLNRVPVDRPGYAHGQSGSRNLDGPKRCE